MYTTGMRREGAKHSLLIPRSNSAMLKTCSASPRAAMHPAARVSSERRRHKSSGTRDARLPSLRTTTGAGELKTVALVITFLTAHV